MAFNIIEQDIPNQNHWYFQRVVSPIIKYMECFDNKDSKCSAILQRINIKLLILFFYSSACNTKYIHFGISLFWEYPWLRLQQREKSVCKWNRSINSFWQLFQKATKLVFRIQKIYTLGPNLTTNCLPTISALTERKEGEVGNFFDNFFWQNRKSRETGFKKGMTTS